MAALSYGETGRDDAKKAAGSTLPARRTFSPIVGIPTSLAMSAETIKMPDPIIEPATIHCRIKQGLAREQTRCFCFER